MKTIVHNYMYSDVYSSRLISLFDDRDFIFNLYRGLKPRQYDADDPTDCILVEEDKFVDEIVLIQNGTIEIGFSRLTNYYRQAGNYQFAYCQAGS